MKYVPAAVSVIAQGQIVAKSLQNYLERHPEIDEKCSKNAGRKFYTTGEPADFDSHASLFFGQDIVSEKLHLP